jgi:hypothetical protein
MSVNEFISTVADASRIRPQQWKIWYSKDPSLLQLVRSLDVKHLWYQVWCTRCTFRQFMSFYFQWYSGLRIWKSEMLDYKELKKPKRSAMKLSEILRRIELCMREMIPRFQINLWILSWQFNSYLIIHNSAFMIMKLVSKRRWPVDRGCLLLLSTW